MGPCSATNRRAAELWGRAPQQEASLAAVIIGSPVHDLEVVIERSDGRKVIALANIEPLLNAQGVVEGMCACFQELLEALPMAVYTTDADGRIIFFNQAAADFWGHRPALGSSEWCGSWRLFTPDGDPLPHDQCPMAIASKENRCVRDVEAIAERPDGSRVPFRPYPTPLHDAGGVLVGAVNMLVDISFHKETTARQRLLINELNHRVKNTLAVVQSIVSQTLRNTVSLPVARRLIDDRLLSLARAHDILTAENWEGAELGDIAGAGAARRLILLWCEMDGPSVTVPVHRGFGSRLIERGLTCELGGEAKIAFLATGVICSVDVSLSAAAA